jgi:hypothetical protein
VSQRPCLSRDCHEHNYGAVYLSHVLYLYTLRITLHLRFAKSARLLCAIKCHRNFIEKSAIKWFKLSSVLAAAEGRGARVDDQNEELPQLREVSASMCRIERATLLNLAQSVNLYPAPKYYKSKFGV